MPRTVYGVVVQPGLNFSVDRPGTRLILLENLIDVYTVPFGQVAEGTKEREYVKKLVERFIPHCEFWHPKTLHHIPWSIVGSSEYHIAYMVDLRMSIDLDSTSDHIWTSRPEDLPLTPATKEIVRMLREKQNPWL